MSKDRMIALVLALLVSGCATMHADAPEPAAARAAQQPEFKLYKDLTWDRIIPELGKRSPEIAILHVDPSTQATHLLIRTPAAIHVRKHWHTANETHIMLRGSAVFACEGHQAKIGPGSFNFMPSGMVHEAWLPADSLTFITVDRAWDITWVEGPPTAKDLGAGARPPKAH